MSAPRGAPRLQPRTAARRGREVALQMLYQWEIGQSDIEHVLQSVLELEPAGSTPNEETRTLAEQLCRGTITSLTVSDPLISEEAAHWRLARMAVIDRLILRLAVHELLNSETPKPVIINEAIELAKKFSTDDSAKFINGVLDAVKRRLETQP